MMSASHPLWWEERGSYCPPTDFNFPDEAQVVIVGAGFTGLWTAYYLLRDRPGTDVLVLEAEHVGFGASGRNGGWVSALFPVGAAKLAGLHGVEATRDLLAALRHTVDEVGAAVSAEGFLGVSFVKGGALFLARNPAQVVRAKGEVAAGEQWGDGTMWLPSDAARERLAATNTLGATWNPHCARLQPTALVDGLAAAVRRLGGRIVEGVSVAGASPGQVRLLDGRTVRAGHIVRATEAYTARLSGLRRRLAPVYSLIVATESLPASTWEAIGLARREVFSDYRNVIVYGQRTEDDRLVFGGRGAPYHFGSGVRPEFDGDERVFASLRKALREMLPQLGNERFTHAWGGPLGIPRDWHPAVGYDPVARVGWAGGYVGDGVAATNLAGRTLADLVSGRHTALTRLPWVDHRSPEWEPEPFRWLGVNAGLRLAALADREEALTGRPARLGAALEALTGH